MVLFLSVCLVAVALAAGVVVVLALKSTGLAVLEADRLRRVAETAAEDADARRFRALELLEQEQGAREADRRFYIARLEALHAVLKRATGDYRGGLEELEQLLDPGAAKRRVM